MPVFKSNESEFFASPPLALVTIKLRNEKKLTCNKFLPNKDGPYRILSVQHYKLTIDNYGVQNKISIDRATPASSRNLNANVGDERSSIKGQREILEKEYQAPEGKLAERERFETKERNAHPTSTSSVRFGSARTARVQRCRRQ